MDLGICLSREPSACELTLLQAAQWRTNGGGWISKLEFGKPMNAKTAWILTGTLLITAASTLAGCASTPLADSRSAEKAGTSKDIDGSINDSGPNANVCHVLRDTLVDLNDAGITFNIFSLFGPVIIRTAN
jgi:hypothetical protein